MPIKTLIFDVGNVLLHWNPQAVIDKTFAGTQYKDQFTVDMFRVEDWLAFDQGLVTEAEIIQKFAEQWSIPTALAETLVMNAKVSLTPKKDTIEWLPELKSQGYKLLCLTNMSDEFFSHLEVNHDFWHHFDDIIVSGRVRMIKPDPAIYQYVIERHQLEPQEALFFDDLDENIRGAESVGLQGIVFADAAQAKKAFAQTKN